MKENNAMNHLKDKRSSLQTVILLFLAVSLSTLLLSCASKYKKKTYRTSKRTHSIKPKKSTKVPPYTPLNTSDVTPVKLNGERLEGVWENLNTHSIHAIKKLKNGKYTVTAIYKQKSDTYKEHKIIYVKWENGVLQWQYQYVPTGWYVTYTTQRVKDDELWCTMQNRVSKNGKNRKFVRMMSVVNKEVSNEIKRNKKLKKVISRKKVIGKIYRINGNQIIVASGKIGKNLRMYQKIFVIANGKKVKMKVIFPMQTIAKCKLTRKSAKHLKSLREGMPVYK